MSSEYANSSNLNTVNAFADSFAELTIQHGRARVVDEVLQQHLDAIHDYEFITEDHECFALGREFRNRWNIDEKPWDNFVRLLCGCKHFPFVLLQNPSNAHTKRYEEMIQCPTFTWMSITLGKIGLSLDEVPILDICVLFSDDDLKAMDGETRWRAVEAAYGLVEEILKILRPGIIICCQCVTLGRRDSYRRETWRPAKSDLAQQLCSSISEAENRKAVSINLGGHTLWAVRGFHPGFHRFGKDKVWEDVLVQLFNDVYGPCSVWKRKVVVAKFLSLVSGMKSTLSAMGSLLSVKEAVAQELRSHPALQELFLGLREYTDHLNAAISCLEDAFRSN